MMPSVPTLTPDSLVPAQPVGTEMVKTVGHHSPAHGTDQNSMRRTVATLTMVFAHSNTQRSVPPLSTTIWSPVEPPFAKAAMLSNSSTFS